VNGEGIGAVVVLNEVTELRRLEQVRRDFVSNVSHELKTPVTSIKGFVETLLDGAMNDPQEARRFLEIVARQSERLNAIIEDLLMLSRLEQTDEAADEILETAPLVGPLREAVDLCSPAANARGITIELTCEPEIEARINPNLIQQGVVNLIDNALKYSEDRTRVSVEAIESDDEILIFVRDQGCGIAADHLPRLFERFYRVDRARSRDLGGTGLGLSIVRHIVQCHHGRVTVESTPGIGSSFCIHLPRPVGAAAVG
jgi:two-component system phosphate regulon sensor histidine kinase PhoR